MSGLPVFFRIRSEYFESDASRYRLAISQQTLIQSMRNQTDQDFSVILNQSPMDPFLSKRRGAFSLSEIVIPEHEFAFSQQFMEPRIEIVVGDDDFLAPTFVESIRKIPFQQKNSFLLFPHGYIFFEGKLHVWRDRECFVETTMIVDPSQQLIPPKNNVLCSEIPSWIYCRHQMNSFHVDEKRVTEAQCVKNLNWPGWNEKIVAAYCRTSVKTATANGSTHEALRSKSVRVEKKGKSRTRRFGK